MTNETEVVESAPSVQTTAKPLDFEKIDALRRHMLLTVDSFVKLAKTSRVSYYNWMKGQPIRPTTAARVRKVVRSFAELASDGAWPNAAVYVATQAERLKMMQETLENLDKQAA